MCGLSTRTTDNEVAGVERWSSTLDTASWNSISPTTGFASALLSQSCCPHSQQKTAFIGPKTTTKSTISTFLQYAPIFLQPSFVRFQQSIKGKCRVQSPWMLQFNSLCNQIKKFHDLKFIFVDLSCKKCLKCVARNENIFSDLDTESSCQLFHLQRFSSRHSATF